MERFNRGEAQKRKVYLTKKFNRLKLKICKTVYKNWADDNTNGFYVQTAKK